MSESNIDIVVRVQQLTQQAFDQVAKELKKLETGAKDAGGAASSSLAGGLKQANSAAASSTMSFRQMTASFSAAYLTVETLKTGVRALTGFILEGITEYMQAERVQRQLTAALDAQGRATPTVIAGMNALASSFQQTTVYSDDLVKEMQALLIQVGNVAPEQMGKALKASTDLASGLGIDLRTATLLVGKAFAGETGTLSRYGIALDDARVSAEGVDYIMGELQKRFGGQARAEAESHIGQIQRLQNSWSDLKESVGEYFLTLGTQGWATEVLIDMQDVLSRNLKDLGSLQGMLNSIKRESTVDNMPIAPARPTFGGGLQLPMYALGSEIAQSERLAEQAARQLKQSAKASEDAAKAMKAAWQEWYQGVLAQRDAVVEAAAVAGAGMGAQWLNGSRVVASRGGPTFDEWGNLRRGTVDGSNIWVGAPLTASDATASMLALAMSGGLPTASSWAGAPGRSTGGGWNWGTFGSGLTGAGLGALMGGGSLTSSLGGAAGSMLGSWAGGGLSTAMSGISGALPALLGGLGSFLPGIGTIAGAGLGSLFGKLFGGEGKKTNDMRDQWLAQAGGLDAVRQMADYAGASIDKLLSTKKTKTFEAEVKKLEAAFKATQERVQLLTSDLLTLGDRGGLVTDDLWARLSGDRSKPEVQEALAQFAGQQTERGIAGISGFVGLRGSLSEQLAAATAAGDTEATSRLQRTLAALPVGQAGASAVGASIAGYAQVLQEQGASPLEALQQLGPTIQSWQQQLGALEMGGGEAFDSIARMAKIAGDEIAGPVLTATTNLGDSMVSLANLGLMNQETFSGLTSIITGGIAALIEQGHSADDVIALNRESLQRVWELQREGKYTVDETTQALLDQAEASGQIGEKFMPAEDRLLLGLDKLILRLDEFLGRLTGGVERDALTAAGTLYKTFDGLEMPTVRVPVDYDYGAGTAPPGPEAAYASGGLITRPHVARVGEGGEPELIGPVDFMARVLAQAMGRGGGGQPMTIEVPVRLDGREIGRASVKHVPAAAWAYGVGR